MAAGMGAAQMGSSIAGGWISAIGGISQATEQQNQLDQQAENERYQALLNDRRAAVAQKAGEVEAERRSRQIAIDLGSNRAAFAGNGLLLDGSADTTAAIEDATIAEGWQDIGIIKENAAMQVWGYLTNAAQQRTSAGEMNRQGKKGVKGAKAMAIASVATMQGANSSGMQSYFAGRQSSQGGGSAATYQWSGMQDNRSTYGVQGAMNQQAYA